MQWKLVRCVLAAFVVMAGSASAQQPSTPPYGLAITLDDAKHYLSDLPVYRVTRMGALLSVVVDHREYLAEGRIAHQPLAGALPRRVLNPAY